MNAGPSPVDLAREPDFQLGALTVRPSRREIAAGETRSFLEPRVMQALVALVRREGEVVSRDELISACWGRIVGDDAINACVAKVRRAGEATAAFAIETIPRVGYRLQSVEKPPAAPAAGVGIVLAVLPFENLSDDGGLGYFSDGVSEEILNTLARRTDIRVIGRSSSFQVRDKTIANVVRQLGASHVLDGAVQRSGDKVRISAQLIDCSTQTALWADRFEHNLSDVFALQDQVATAVAGAMRRTVGARVRTPVDPVAYDLFLRGVAVPIQPTPAALQRKADLLEAAIARAPELAEAWGGLAFVHAQMAGVSRHGAQDLLEQARGEAARALELDATCAPAAWAMARVEPWYGRFLEQESWVAKALAWAPHDSGNGFIHAHFLQHVGRIRESVAVLRQAVELNPVDYTVAIALASALFVAGELEAAASVASDVVRRWPEFKGPPAALASIVAAQGDLERARRILATHDDDRVYQAGAKWYIDLAAMQPEEARQRAAATLRKQVDRFGRLPLDTLAAACWFGAVDEAFDLAARSELGPLDGEAKNAEALALPALFIVWGPQVRRDPRFVALCGRLGLVDYWVATENWPDCVEEVAPYYDFKAECRRAVEARRSG